ncbi:Vacuolar (H+)-ATPase G subunit [Parasponia andersonii]|uniref:V-type proton ATPase subunit G n=1 Tax=Parasponia andersonii TaxID=3476 RepID=A0A2P5BLN6_PARAD|nr:Vacuolar (H+)-ATPase G subunit [Parasponia andersonii]
MDSFRSGQGIQMLLTAEQEAQHIISSARNLRTTRLKQAKDEAEKEMTLYRSNLEAEHQTKKSKTSSESIAKRLEEETEGKIESLKESASRVSPDVVAMLLSYVTTIKN